MRLKSLNATSEETGESFNAALKNVSLLTKSIGPNPSVTLSEISRFPGDSSFFDLQKMKDYVSSGTFIPNPTADMTSTSGDDIVEMANNFSSGISVGGGYGFSSGASVSGSMSSEFASSRSHSSETKFSQTRIFANFGSISLPPPIKRDELRSLASESTLKLIDGCNSEAKAEKMVGPNGLGAVYIRSGSFGAVLVMSTFSESKSFSSSKELEIAVQAEAAYLTDNISSDAKFTIGKQRGRRNRNMQVNVVSKGGNPTLILRGDYEGWLKSSKRQPIISKFSLAPISDLAHRGSDAENFLLKAVEKVCLGELGRFSVIGDRTKRIPRHGNPKQPKHIGGVYECKSESYNGKNIWIRTDNARFAFFNGDKRWCITNTKWKDGILYGGYATDKIWGHYASSRTTGTDNFLGLRDGDWI